MFIFVSIGVMQWRGGSGSPKTRAANGETRAV